MTHRFPHTTRRVRLPQAAAILAALLAAGPGGACAAEPGWQLLSVSGAGGSGRLALHLSRDWSTPQPDVVRAVVTIHGKHRDAAHYDAIAHEALARAGTPGAGTLLITPRFATDDEAGGAGGGQLGWHGNGWMDGDLATTPSPLSSFDAMDAIIARLSDRRLFPHLRQIVLAGHSAGAQFVQRYAVLTHGEARAIQAGIAVRYVIANPSSYSWFGSDRPTAGGGLAPYPADECPGFNEWKYGLQALPPYAGNARPGDLERGYAGRDVTYLLGSLDTDPALRALDHSCAAEAQGATHLQRGHAFFHSLQLRHPHGLQQLLHEIPGVGHDATAMLTSGCALAAIYDTPSCGNPVAPAGITAPSRSALP